MGKQPVQGQKKSKEAIARAAAASRKGQKKKWVKSSNKDKLNREVYLTKENLAAMEKQMPRMNVITLNLIMEKFNIVGGLAKKIIEKLLNDKLILPIGTQNHKFNIFRGVDAGKAKEEVPKGKGQKKENKNKK